MLCCVTFHTTNIRIKIGILLRNKKKSLPLQRNLLITMKLKEQYKVREMAGEHVIIMQGKHGSDLTKIISLNESALYLWGELSGKEFSVESVAELLVERYGIDNELAIKDAQHWVDKLVECKVIE